jgi:hypothetical protein
MSDYTDFMAKTQDEILNAVKQAQETNVKAFTSFGEALAEYANKARAMGTTATIPSPAEIVTSTFGFAAQLVELQKNYYVKIAETFANAQKKASETVTAAKK